MIIALLLVVLSSSIAPTPDESADVAAARQLFERNLAAIQQRDREQYLDCYWDSERLVRAGATGLDLGFADMAAGAPATGSDEWPDELVARDLQLTWLDDGLVFGSYRYAARFGGVVREGLSERLFRRTADGWRIVVTTAFDQGADQPGPPLALVGATLHDGSGGEPLHDAVIITRDGRIEAVGARDVVDVPADVEQIELHGQHVVPGLVDTHVHYSQTGWADGRPDARDLRDRYPYEQVAVELELQPERFHRAFLACGVTAVFDVGGYPWTRRLGARTENSDLAPHVAAAGPLLATWVPDALGLADQHQMLLIETVDDVRRAVRGHVAAGSDAIKIWFIVLNPEDVQRQTPLLMAAGEAARAAGLPLIVHATELEAARVALQAGATLLVHSVEDAPVDQAFIDLALASGASYCPTLTVRRGYVQLYRGVIDDELEGQLAVVAGSIAERVRRTPTEGRRPGLTDASIQAMLARMDAALAVSSANLFRLHEAGVPVVLGTDAGNPLTLHGPSVFPELEAMQAAGMSPSAVLRAATRDAAAVMGRGRGDDLGLIAPGRIADLIVLPGDPSTDIAQLRGLTHVMRAGTLHTAESLRPR